MDEKEKFLNNVKQNTDKIKQDLGDFLKNEWNTKIAEIKNTMKVVEADRKKAVVTDAKN